jgi:tripartite-type tricarboxylate transporter receptor subunit TctC
VQTTRRQGLNPVPSTPEEFAQLIKDELQRWRSVITERG